VPQREASGWASPWTRPLGQHLVKEPTQLDGTQRH
jgi:hypothetical protein